MSVCCPSAPRAGVSLLTFLSVFEHPLKTCSRLRFHLSVYMKNSNVPWNTTIKSEIEKFLFSPAKNVKALLSYSNRHGL